MLEISDADASYDNDAAWDNTVTTMVGTAASMGALSTVVRETVTSTSD
jgi:hypothetical protein